MFLGKLEQAFIERKKMPEEILEMYKNGTLQSFLSLDKPLSDIFPTQDDFIQELERVWKLLSISYLYNLELVASSYDFLQMSSLCLRRMDVPLSPLHLCEKLPAVYWGFLRGARYILPSEAGLQL